MPTQPNPSAQSRQKKQSKQPSQPQRPMYILRGTAHGLDQQFYRRYDPSFLYNKALALNYITKNQDRFADLLQAFEETDQHIDNKYFESLRAELHFMEMHQFESFFALLITIYQPKTHWIYLTE